MDLQTEGSEVVLNHKAMLVWLRGRGFSVHMVWRDSASNLTVFTDVAQSVEMIEAVRELPKVVECRASAPGIFRVIYNALPSERPIL